MKLNKSRALVVVLATVMLLTGISAIFIGWRLSKEDQVINEPGGAVSCSCSCNGSAGSYTSKYCGVISVDGEQTIGGNCWETGTHCNAEAQNNGQTCNEDHEYPDKIRKLHDGPCEAPPPPPPGNGCEDDADCPSDQSCDFNTCKSCGSFTGEGQCWSHVKCQWLNNKCVLGSGGGGGGGDCEVTGGGDGSSCTITAKNKSDGSDCSVQVSVATCRESFTSQDAFNTGTNNGAECRVGCGSTTQTVTGSKTFSVGEPSCGRWQLDVVYGGTSLCNGFGCNDEGCSDGSPAKKVCLETCSVDSDCSTGLKCGTVGTGKICIDADLSNGDQCFNLSCTSLTSSKTTANVGDSTNLNVSWSVPSTYTVDWTKILRQKTSGFETIKQCNSAATCASAWTVTPFSDTPANKHVFSSQLSFKAYGYSTSLVCTEDDKIIAQVSGNPQVGKCTNNCTAQITPAGQSVLPECTGLAFVKTDPTDIVFPIPGKFEGTGKNGDSTHLVTKFEIATGATKIEKVISAAALANLTLSENYTANAATEAILSFMTSDNTKYTSAGCRVTIEGGNETVPPTEPPTIPKTGIIDDSIKVLALTLILSYLTYFLYKNKIGSSIIVGTMISGIGKKNEVSNNLKTSVNSRKQKINKSLLNKSDKKKEFEKDTIEKFEK